MIPAEAIERVIDDFETRIEKLEPFKRIEYVSDCMRTFIIELRKVVAEYGKGKS